MRRLSAALATIALVVATAAVAWFVGRGAATPAEVSLPLPPEPSLLAVPIETTRLEKSIVTRGTVAFAEPQQISLAGMEVTGKGVVTAAAESGSSLAEGDLVLEVDARPVLLLQGPRPVFRSVSAGMSGPDVTQLQQALVRLGHPLDVDGSFGSSTELAVIRFFVARGYPPALAQELSTNRKATASRLWLEYSNDPSCGREAAEGSCSVFDDLVDVYRLSGAGVIVPFGEILFVKELPVVVGTPTARTGDAASTSVVVLSAPVLQVGSFVPTIDAQLIEIGAEVLVDDEAVGLEAAGRVVDLRTAEEEGSIGNSVRVVVELSEGGQPLLGRSVRVQIPILSTETAVRAVPLAALRTDTSGNAWVQLLDNGDSTSWLQVRAGVEANGLVEIEAIDGTIPSEAWVVVSEEDPP